MGSGVSQFGVFSFGFEVGVSWFRVRGSGFQDSGLCSSGGSGVSRFWISSSDFRDSGDSRFGVLAPGFEVMGPGVSWFGILGSGFCNLGFRVWRFAVRGFLRFCVWDTRFRGRGFAVQGSGFHGSRFF